VLSVCDRTPEAVTGGARRHTRGMRRDEAEALGAAAGDSLAAVTDRLEELHRAIARRAFGPSAAPARSTHDTIAGGVYATVRGVGAAAGRVVGLVAGATRAADAAPLARAPRLGALQGALNGAFGDTIHARHPALSPAMAVRVDGRDVPLTAAAVAAAFPAAGSRVVVFLHGLGETERSWRRREHKHGRELPASYAALLERDLGLTGVELRYNSGRHISENGEELARLLGDLVATWPVELGGLTLVGHSMGGLIIRSALHHGRLGAADWLPRIERVVSLGSPFLGAPLERATNRATWALAKLPETAPLAKLVNLRAAGVKDLRHGALLREDWDGTDPDALGRDTAQDVHHLTSAQHFCVSASLGAGEGHPLGLLLGDILVPAASANGSGRSAHRTPLAFDDAAHFPGLSHFDLLNHPAVYARLRAWLSPPG
jgi:pimeloyl-ACP methyl ester carboxylesterase